MMKKILLFMLLGMFLVSLVSAECSLPNPIQQGNTIELTQTCSNCTEVNLTKIMSPNQTISLLGQFPMTANGTNYNYTFSNTEAIGKYFYTTSGILNGVSTQQSCNFEVTSTGIESSEQRTTAVSRIIFVLFSIAIALFIAFLFANTPVPVKWTFFLISMMFLLQTVNFLFIGLKDEFVNPSIENYFSFLTSASFILFWFLFGLLAVMWFLTTLQTILMVKAKNSMERNNG